MNPADLFPHDEHPVTLAEGGELFRAGEAAQEMFVLLEDSADIRVGNAIVEEAGPGALLGEMAMIEESPRVATVIARTPCRLARIDRARFNYLIQQNPFFAVHVMKVLVERLRRMNKRVAGAN
ncbi:MAG: cyclic nucleotide-binding domain-containing protein [Gammaproteobacteria bacterium]|nr:cyclic nucleotide-binding domain-containing protein [Gammaproteobacteria bacterium]